MTSKLVFSACFGEKGASSDMICFIGGNVVFSGIEDLYSLDLHGDTMLCFSLLLTLLGLALYFGES